jgi:hypothetical protein
MASAKRDPSDPPHAKRGSAIPSSGQRGKESLPFFADIALPAKAGFAKAGASAGKQETLRSWRCNDPGASVGRADRQTRRRRNGAPTPVLCGGRSTGNFESERSTPCPAGGNMTFNPTHARAPVRAAGRFIYTMSNIEAGGKNRGKRIIRELSSL